MKTNLKDMVQKWKETKKYLKSFGWELGTYDFATGENYILKVTNKPYKGYLDIVGHIKLGELSSIRITKEKYKNIMK